MCVVGLVRDYKEDCFYFEIVDWVRKMLLGGTSKQELRTV